MKSRIFLFLLSFTLIGLVNPISASHAIFGLSKCEKVKEAIIKIENKLNSKQNYWYKYENKVIPINKDAAFRIYAENTMIEDIWRLSFNNPKCFTRSQNLQVKKLSQLSMNDIILWFEKDIFRDDKKCDAIGQLKNYQYCKISRGIFVSKVYVLKSLYLY